MLRYTEVIDDNGSSRIKRNACSDKSNLNDTGIFFQIIIILSLVNTLRVHQRHVYNFIIKENLSNFEVPQIRTVSKKRTHLSLAKKVEAKVSDFDIKRAVKLLSSNDSLAAFNEDVAEE
jgi:hypothetical protein